MYLERTKLGQFLTTISKKCGIFPTLYALRKRVDSLLLRKDSQTKSKPLFRHGPTSGSLTCILKCLINECVALRRRDYNYTHSKSQSPLGRRLNNSPLISTKLWRKVLKWLRIVLRNFSYQKIHRLFLSFMQIFAGIRYVDSSRI